MPSASPIVQAAPAAQRDGEVFVYGLPRPDVVDTPHDATQTSPLHPGSRRLQDVQAASAAELVVVAPAGTLERRYVLALALQALRPGGALSVLAPKQKGGARLREELQGFGCEVEEAARRHHRVCYARRPPTLAGIEAAVAAGAPRVVDGVGWTQPGLFSWDRLDPGTRLLRQSLPQLCGRGADFGGGVGALSQAALASPAVTHLALIDLDRRAIDAARRNVADPRASFHWADVRAPVDPQAGLRAGALDFVVTNPPFHDGGAEDLDLGRAFLRRGHEALRSGGALWLVANRHLPYEALLKTLFTTVALRAEAGGFKVYEARR